MRIWQRHLGSHIIRRITIGLILGLALGMVPLTLFLVKQELIARAGKTVALGAADIADKLDMVLAERLGDIQAFSRTPVLIQKDTARIVAYLEQLKQVYPIYQRLSVVGTEGRVTASTDPGLLGRSFSSDAWFQVVARDPQPYTELVLEPEQPGGALSSLRLAVQLRDRNGEWQGALMTEVHEQTLRAFVMQTTHRGDQPAFRPEIAEFLILSTAGEVLLMSDARPDTGSNQKPVRLPSTILADQGKAGYVEEADADRGIDALTGFARMDGLRDEPELRWTILVRADRDAVLHSIWTLLWKLTGIGTVCLLPLLALLSWSWYRQTADKTRASIAHRALEANEARTRKIVDIALDAVITIDERGLVTDWNPQAERIFGWAAAEVLGQPLTNRIIPPQYREAHEHGFRQYKETGMGPVLNRRIEITALDRSGREFPVELAITPMRLDGHTIFSAFLRDITERKRAEDELRRTQAAAESANRAKTEFLANMSHELRTPLNAILGTSELLLESALTPDQRQCALMSQRASQALLRLVDDVLDLAKIEAGTLRLESTPFDVTELLEPIQHLLELRQRHKHVVLRVETAPDIPTRLEGDGFRLQQVLLNLLGNALKFTERGSVSLAVTMANTDLHRPLLRFTVTDTGIGIPSGQLNHIFGRFTQVDSGDSRKYGGAGLGLSICKQLVDMMGGAIQVASEIGKGSTFTVTLPFSVAAAASQAAPSPAGPDSTGSISPRPTGTNGGLFTILLVDDSPETGQLASLYLKHHPYRLELAGDGPTAIQRCRTHRYDLVFLDLQMPGMDGYTTTVAIRAWEHAQDLPPVPIIALTADVLGDARERSTEAGCTGFMGKPFSQAAFLAAIRQYADLPAASPARSPSNQPPSDLRQPDGQELDRLRRKFLVNRRDDLETLSRAASEQDWPTIQTIGHRMKGLAGSYGLEEIGAIGAALETAAIERQMERVVAERLNLAQILARLDPTRERAA